MKPYFEKLTENPDHSFLIRKIVRNKRDNINQAGVWHYHPDYEITYTLTSQGKRFVGYHIEDYEAGDLVLIGENLPHCWITNEPTEQLVITFKKDFLGKNFIERPELKEIHYLLKRSKRGLKFGSNTQKQAAKLIQKIEQSEGFMRLMYLFSLLNLMAKAEDVEYLTQISQNVKHSLSSSSRIETIYSYVLDNYKQNEISLSYLASQLNMTNSALCKFIKNATKKTLFELVLEARVNEACRLLVESDKYISEICYLSGFNNVSNFNKVFKRIMGKAPNAYRHAYRNT